MAEDTRACQEPTFEERWEPKDSNEDLGVEKETETLKRSTMNHENLASNKLISVKFPLWKAG